jgi:acyl carrier protein
MSTLEILQDLLIGEYKLTREQLTPDAQLTTLGVDSLGLIELMFQIEDRFGVTLPDDNTTKLLTVNDVVVYIDKLVALQPAAPGAAGADSRVVT